MERRFEIDKDFERQYKNVMIEYETLGHMKPVENNVKSMDSKIYFLPHHAVMKSDSVSTKLSVVFDSTCKPSNGNSLNSILGIVVSRRKQRSAFHQVSEFDRGRIVAYRGCGLSFREIDSCVGRNQTAVMRICDRWMQEGTTNRRCRSHTPQCTTSLSARTIRHHLQQSGLSARRPLLGLPLTHNHRRLRRQWCDERRMWAAEWNEVVFTDESRICLQHHDGRIRVWRHRGERMLNSCVMHLHTGPAPDIMV
ncbi:transposable element Tcb1 transposase [Trichonephila clavipes]|nr:transposable element Tcb1 transposase [Trichonephila clavipes]